MAVSDARPGPKASLFQPRGRLYQVVVTLSPTRQPAATQYRPRAYAWSRTCPTSPSIPPALGDRRRAQNMTVTCTGPLSTPYLVYWSIRTAAAPWWRSTRRQRGCALSLSKGPRLSPAMTWAEAQVGPSEVTYLRARPWAEIWRLDAASGRWWLKVNAAGTAYEARLLPALSRTGFHWFPTA